MGELILPVLLVAVACLGLRKRQNVYDLMTQGAEDGLRLLFSIAPSIIILLAAVHMLRASGGMELLTGWLSPLFHLLGIPPETAPLMLIRPFSGSAALAVGTDLIASYGADSTVGRTAAIMLGSTETTFYTIAVYFGAAKIQKTRYAIPAALLADLTGFGMAALTARLFF